MKFNFETLGNNNDQKAFLICDANFHGERNCRAVLKIDIWYSFVYIICRKIIWNHYKYSTKREYSIVCKIVQLHRWKISRAEFEGL